MRTYGSDHISQGEQITITFDGQPVPARRNETIAAALTAAGLRDLRRTASGTARGVFCGMGLCQDCLVTVDGRPNQRACMTKIDRPVAVQRQVARPEAAACAPTETRWSQWETLRPDVLVVGGGAAGLAAATTLRRYGVDVVLVDERPTAGGQYFKQLATSSDLPFQRFADRQMAQGATRLRAAENAGVRLLSGTEISAVFGGLCFVAVAGSAVRLIKPKRVVVATGAYEQGLPVPGWTLPGVMTSGAAQTLLRSYRVAAARRVIVAGNGPLNLQVALELARAGVTIVAIAELAKAPWRASPGALFDMLRGSPALTAKGLALLGEIAARRIPMHYGTKLSCIEQTDGGLRVRLAAATGEPHRGELEADVVAMGYGFAPAQETLRLLGCRSTESKAGTTPVIERTSTFETSVSGVYAVGDCAGLGGAHAAEVEGALAGLAIAGELGKADHQAILTETSKLSRKLARHRRFQSGLWGVHGAPPGALAVSDAGSVICRCEDVSLGRIESAIAEGASMFGSLKRQTRMGMGRCQARYCTGPASMALRASPTGLREARPAWAPRPPIKPVPIGLLACLELDDDAGIGT